MVAFVLKMSVTPFPLTIKIAQIEIAKINLLYGNNLEKKSCFSESFYARMMWFFNVNQFSHQKSLAIDSRMLLLAKPLKKMTGSSKRMTIFFGQCAAGSTRALTASQSS